MCECSLTSAGRRAVEGDPAPAPPRNTGGAPVRGPAADPCGCARKSSRGDFMSQGQFPVTHTEAEWRALLTPEQYAIMREHATERPGSCALLHEKRPGVFSCAGCGQPLFEGERRSSTAAPAGRASRRPFAGSLGRMSTIPGGWRGRKCIARNAARISATSFPTARRRPACATASTGWRPISRRRSE